MGTEETGTILLTGATGYIGGRLLRALEESGRTIRCLARRPEHLSDRVGERVQVVEGDLLEPESLSKAIEGTRAAYYLVHSMGSRRDFEKLDRQAARNFAEAASRCGLRRIIYVSGLGDSRTELSSHLRSRQQVGRILASTGIPVIELRASIVLGSGSLSFELIRALVERLPVMVTPRWVSVRAQPIGVNDLLAYLIESLAIESDGHRIFEIGGSDRVSYGNLMREYARQRGVRRLMIPVPVLTPRLSSLWLGLVTPVYARVGKQLIDGLRHPTVVQDEAALDAFAVRPKGVREAIADALRNEDREFAETRWFDSVCSAGARWSWGGTRFGNRLIDQRSRWVAAPAEEAFEPIRRIGGGTGWYFADWLWRIRGFIDLLLGGVGMRRGRRHPVQIRVGDPIDFWRVESFEAGRRLRLFAEMNLPGRGWLELEAEPEGQRTLLRLTAVFDPVGLLGLLYWHSTYPLHHFVFNGMLRGIAREVTRCRQEPSRSR